MRMRNARGTTLVELLAAMGLAGIFMGVAALSLRPAETSLEDGARLVEGFFRNARAKAMASASAYRVSVADPGEARLDYAESCSSTTWTADKAIELTLPRDVTFADTSWTVCFTERGAASAATLVALWHPQRGTRQVEVMLGGVARVVP